MAGSSTIRPIGGNSAIGVAQAVKQVHDETQRILKRLPSDHGRAMALRLLEYLAGDQATVYERQAKR